MNISQRMFSFESFDLLYLSDADSGQISMVLLPPNMPHRYLDRRVNLDIPELKRNALPCPAWEVGSLCHLSLRNRAQSNGAAGTLLGGISTKEMKCHQQDVVSHDGSIEIRTVLRSDDGYEIVHTAAHHSAEDGIEVQTVFTNRSAQPVQLELLTSFALDNLSPFALDDAPLRIKLHRFYGGWSHEGRHRVDSLEQLSLERTWYNCRPESERFGVLGSFPVDRYFPFAVVEDSSAGVFWGAQLACNSSWQMEFCRLDDCLVFAGGLADREFGAWHKTVQPGESFAAPKAFLSVGRSLQGVCNQLTGLHQKYVQLQPASEQELPVICNEWCTSWGNPNEDEILALGRKFAGTPVKYIVIDAGWSKSTNPHLGQGGNGDWALDPDKFPHGLLPVSRALRKLGMQLGIWFEFEVTTSGARVYEKDYDSWHLTRADSVIITGDGRSFWDFRKPEVLTYLKEKVLRLIQENEIGYLKVDYNGSIGIGCDGAESLGEGLRQQMQAVRDFFLLLRRECPSLVIENCSSGGHRLEPSMMDITALSSSTDAHECLDVPIITANTDLLILPRQNFVFCTLDHSHDLRRMRYCISSGFMGRMGLSGDILALGTEQWALVQEAMQFYTHARTVLKDCTIAVYRELKTDSVRYAEGLQAVLFTGRNSSALLVCHSFSNAGSHSLSFPFPAKQLRLSAQFGFIDALSVADGRACLAEMPDHETCALLFELVD